ncbi:MAG: hypothetical protein Q9M37_01940 [Desulfonauticus sp.]|nr:hypothetical protein [Desulfonauticus sp.]
MKILVIVDENPYSMYVIKEISRISLNTWSDITIMGFIDENEKHRDVNSTSIAQAMVEYLQIFSSSYNDSFCPYTFPKEMHFSSLDKNHFLLSASGKKKLNLVISKNEPVASIVNKVQQERPSLLAIGCDKSYNCQWKNKKVPSTVAQKVSCSVLVVKETKNPETIVCCLDNNHITQTSLELINQLATLYKADLKIVGIAENNLMRDRVENTMKEIMLYYLNQDIPIWLEVVDKSILSSFLNQVAQKDMVALWLGKQSFLEKFISKEKINHLINDTPSTVLLLR